MRKWEELKAEKVMRGGLRWRREGGREGGGRGWREGREKEKKIKGRNFSVLPPQKLFQKIKIIRSTVAFFFFFFPQWLLNSRPLPRYLLGLKVEELEYYRKAIFKYSVCKTPRALEISGRGCLRLSAPFLNFSPSLNRIFFFYHYNYVKRHVSFFNHIITLVTPQV